MLMLSLPNLALVEASALSSTELGSKLVQARLEASHGLGISSWDDRDVYGSGMGLNLAN